MIYDKISLRADKAREIAKTKKAKRAKGAIMFIIVFFVFGGFFLLINETKAQELVKIKEVNEIIELRTEKTQTFKIEENKKTVRVYAIPQWKNDGGNWVILDSIKKEKEIFLNRLFNINTVYATTTTSTAPLIDGAFRNTGATWVDLHDEVSSNDLFLAETAKKFIESDLAGSAFAISRGVLTFQIDLPINKEIVSGSLFIYPYDKNNGDNDGLDYLTIVEGTYVTSTISVSDFDFTKHGTVELINNINIGDITTGAYNELIFNQAGLDYLATSTVNSNGLLKFIGMEGHDFEDTTILAGERNEVGIYYSEQTGTTQDPYIEYTYIDIEEETPTTTPATTTMPTLEGGGLIDYIYITDNTGSTSYMYIPFLNYLVIVFTIFTAGLIIFLAVKL